MDFCEAMYHIKTKGAVQATVTNEGVYYFRYHEKRVLQKAASHKNWQAAYGIDYLMDLEFQPLEGYHCIDCDVYVLVNRNGIIELPKSDEIDSPLRDDQKLIKLPIFVEFGLD